MIGETRFAENQTGAQEIWIAGIYSAERWNQKIIRRAAAKPEKPAPTTVMVGIIMFGVPTSGGDALEIPPQGGTPNFTTLAKTPAAFAPDSAISDQRTCTRCAGKVFPSPSASARDQLLEPIHPRSSAGEMFSRPRVAQEANRLRTAS